MRWAVSSVVLRRGKRRLRAINAMVKASEKKHANIMLYIKFPLAYMLTRKSAETDWSRYETATVRQKGFQCGGS